MIASQSLANNTYDDARPTEATRFDAALRQHAHINGSLHEAAAQIEAIADRLVGGLSEVNEPCDGKLNVPNGALARYDAALEGSEDALTRIHAALERFSGAV